jgi:predicted O-methyltransferase YrrM
VKRSRTLLAIARAAELVALPLTWCAAVWLKALRRFGFRYLPASKALLQSVGVLPVRDHYYEPLINPGRLRLPLDKDRELPALDFNVSEQLARLARFTYRDELLKFPHEPLQKFQFHYRNGSFGSGDAEYLYSLIRLEKPRRIVEIGCGASTLMMRHAIERNIVEDPRYACEHICIEPYEQPWLEELGVQVVRKRVEECDKDLFTSLQGNDLLFIDSSHVIRPQGDVLFEYLEVLPLLRPGVFVHIHDIFTPKDYLKEWVVDDIKFWNEQYLLEAFLSFNPEFRIIGALNYLTHNHAEKIGNCFPILQSELATREPGSFWIVRQ